MKKVKKAVSKKSKKRVNYFKPVGKFVWFVIKLPYYFVKGSYALGKRVSKKSEEVRVSRRREAMDARHEKFRVLKVVDGDYDKWLKHVAGSDSQIGIVLGARGSGKTAFGVKFLENFHAKYKKKCFAMGFRAEELPSWIGIVSGIDEIKNNSLVLIDEGGILFNSRSSMSSANKLLSELIMIARHKNISILFVSQNSSNLEVNVLRQADFLVLKPSSLLQKDFERKIVQKIYGEAEGGFKEFGEEDGVGYVYGGKFRGFVVNPLPSFWKEGISKSFSS
ncbi:MAG: hypothetical protein KJ592_04560 [Nanoarchaeota archaeon]|nr:hypothetical protein [Nanoarchaeota archaeon]